LAGIEGTYNLMQPHEIGRSYDSIARTWRSPHIQSSGIEQFKRALRFVRDGKLALDIGCGCSNRFINLLGAAGFQVEGIDVSQEMIALARQDRPDISFHHQDIVTWAFPRKYDFITAWDSIWHLPLAEQLPVLKKICEGLAPGGVFIFTTGGLDEPSEKSDSCMGPPVHYSTLGIPLTLASLAGFGCICRHLEFDQYPESHLYIIAQKAKEVPDVGGQLC